MYILTHCYCVIIAAHRTPSSRKAPANIDFDEEEDHDVPGLASVLEGEGVRVIMNMTGSTRMMRLLTGSMLVL